MSIVVAQLLIISCISAENNSHVKTDADIEKIHHQMEQENKHFLEKAKSLNQNISDQEKDLQHVNKQAARVLLRDQNKVSHESRKFDVATKQLQAAEANPKSGDSSELKKSIDHIDGKLKAMLAVLRHDQQDFEKNSKGRLASLQAAMQKLAEFKKSHEDKIAQYQKELHKLSEVHVQVEAKHPAEHHNNEAPTLFSHKAVKSHVNPKPLPAVVPLPTPEPKHEKAHEKDFKHWVLKKIRHNHNHIYEKNLKKYYKHADERDQGVKDRLTKIYDKKRSDILNKYHRQLLHYEKVHETHIARLKKKANITKKKDAEEMKEEKVHATAISLTKHHYKVYLRTCETQVKTCINYCARGHTYQRSVHLDHTVTYKCGGYAHGLEPCSGKDFIVHVRQLQTCGDACINEGRCLTFFKNEYSGIHKLCRRIKNQCEKHFCPGKMLKGHLGCILDCGGEMCSDVFEAQHQIQNYLSENAKFIAHMNNVVSEDNDRPAPVNPIIAAGK